eukprot:SAG31_NODE_13103_length_892_cov_1.292560_1_plen_66_part_00
MIVSIKSGQREKREAMAIALSLLKSSQREKREATVKGRALNTFEFMYKFRNIIKKKYCPSECYEI